MAKRDIGADDLFAIGFFAPMVIGARMQMLALEAANPTARGRREALGMLAEKPLALVLGGLAVQAELARQATGWWSAALAGRPPLSAEAASARLHAAAVAPVARTVRANAKRLGRGRRPS